MAMKHWNEFNKPATKAKLAKLKILEKKKWLVMIIYYSVTSCVHFHNIYMRTPSSIYSSMWTWDSCSKYHCVLWADYSNSVYSRSRESEILVKTCTRIYVGARELVEVTLGTGGTGVSPQIPSTFGKHLWPSDLGPKLGSKFDKFSG